MRDRFKDPKPGDVFRNCHGQIFTITEVTKVWIKYDVFWKGEINTGGQPLEEWLLSVEFDI